MNLIQCVKMSSKIGQKWLIQNAPHVLTGMSIGLSCISVGWAIPATIKAEKKIREKQEEVDRITALKGNEAFHDLTNWEKVKTGWTCYIPTMTALGGSIMCSIFANHVSATRIATLATACSLGEKKLNEYQKAIESLDPESQKKIREKIATDYIDENDIDSSRIEDTGHGTTIFIDKETGRRFRASYGWVSQAFKRISDNLVNEMTQSINDLYAELELDESTSGHSLGWRANDWPLNPCFVDCKTETGEKFYVITYPWNVLYDFRDY